MESSNKFGIYGSKVFKVKKKNINQSNYAFILIRSEMDDLILLAKLLKITYYLLKKSSLDMELKHHDTLLSFPVYADNETLKDHNLYMIKNTIPGDTAYQCVGYGNNALFKIQRKKGDKKLPQLFLPLEEENHITNKEDLDEMKRWEEMKNHLKKQSIAFSKKIDYIIPINIATYEVFSPFLLKLNHISEIKLRLVEASDFENFESLFYSLELYTDRLNQEIQKEKDDKLKNLLDIN